MNRFVYTSILANNMCQSAELMGLDHFVFQQDNDPKHTSAHVRHYFESKRIKVLEWPSQSPDLNPIEHVWAHMKRCLATKVFKSKNELKEELQNIWDNITPEFCFNLIDSMPRRIEDVLKVKGGHTFY
jgi:hypothetical protein